jgi:hypothetical protein
MAFYERWGNAAQQRANGPWATPDEFSAFWLPKRLAKSGKQVLIGAGLSISLEGCVFRF